MLGALKRGLLRPGAVSAAASQFAAGRGVSYHLNLLHASSSPSSSSAGALLPGGLRRAFAAAAAAAVGTEQSKQTHKKARPFDKVSKRVSDRLCRCIPPPCNQPTHSCL